MRVALVSIGDELLTGDVVNGNAAWLGRRLTEAGFEVVAVTTVGDGVAAIRAAVRAAAGTAGAVVVTGGLGPTSDDRTVAALTALAGPADRVDRLANPVGSAPGLRIGTAAAVVYALPGVPGEMAAMVEDAVLPDLLVRAGTPTAIVTRTLYVALAGESTVAARLASLERDLAAAESAEATEATEATESPEPAVRLGYLCGPGEVRVRLTALAADRAAADRRLAPWIAQAQSLLGDELSGIDERLDVTVHRLLGAADATLAVAESLTGGLLGGTLTAMPGSSRTFRGGVTAYATDLKRGMLGVDAGLLARRGPVDAAVAAGMAEGVRRLLGATYGLATTGVAGPEPQDGQQPGTVHLAVADAAGTVTAAPDCLRGDREQIRALTVVHALDLLRRRLAGLPLISAGGR